MPVGRIESSVPNLGQRVPGGPVAAVVRIPGTRAAGRAEGRAL
jgi:hypothetical protein